MAHHAMTREQALKALELHADASFQEIKQAYRDLALVWHPDRFAHSTRLQEKASERLKEINIAYDVLRSDADGPSRAHEPRTKNAGSKHDASGTEQSGTQGQRSRPKNRGAASAEQTKSQRNEDAHQPLHRAWVVFAVLLFFAVIAGLLNDRPTGALPAADPAASLSADAGTVGAVAEPVPGPPKTLTLEQFLQLPSTPPPTEAQSPPVQPEAEASESSSPIDPIDIQVSQDSTQPIDLLSIARGDSRPGERAIDLFELLGSYGSITQPDEGGSPAADTAASPSADLEVGSANPVLAVREPEAIASGSSVDALQIATRTISAEDRDHPEMSADLPPNVDKQPVSTGSAYVYVFRPGNDGPPLVEPPVMFIREGKDPTLLAVMDNGRFIKVELESGEYRFFSDHLDKAPVNLILEADGAYYLEMNTAGNPFSRHVGTGALLLATEEQALKEMQDLQPLGTKFVRDPRVIAP